MLEIEIGVDFIVSLIVTHQRTKVNRKKVHKMKTFLTKNLISRYNGHWYASDPDRGSAFRSIQINNGPFEWFVEHCAKIFCVEVSNIFPPNFDIILWIDPGEVSYRCGPAYSPRRTLYKAWLDRSNGLMVIRIVNDIKISLTIIEFVCYGTIRLTFNALYWNKHPNLTFIDGFEFHLMYPFSFAKVEVFGKRMDQKECKVTRMRQEALKDTSYGRSRYFCEL